MTKRQYELYQKKVQCFFDKEKITNLSSDSERTEEYSNRPCDCCGQRSGGYRVEATGYNPDTEEISDFTICQDCEYYVEYGHLDDLTMMEMEK